MKHLRRNFLLYFGSLFAMIGLVVAIFIVKDYWSAVKYIHFHSESSMADLGTFLAGSSGILFTISSVLFFTYSLQQTNREMSETQSIMKRQLAESTFFNLLKHHRELVKSFENDNSLDKKVVKLKGILSKYADSLKSKEFHSDEQTYYSPEGVYQKEQVLMTMGGGLVHIAAFIRDKLNDDVFYHGTFYQSATNEERFLLGMIVMNQLEPEAIQFKFDYTKYYNENSPYINGEKSGYFPPIEIKLPQANFSLESFDRGGVHLSETEIREVTAIEVNGLKEGFNLRKMECRINGGRQFTTFDSVEHKISFYDYLYSGFVQQLSDLKPIIVDLTFVFLDRNRCAYSVTYKKIQFLAIQKDNSKEYIVNLVPKLPSQFDALVSTV